MTFNFIGFKKEFNDKGYFVVKNFIEKKFINQLINEINESKDTVKYFDKFDNLRRIENYMIKENI